MYRQLYFWLIVHISHRQEKANGAEVVVDTLYPVVPSFLKIVVLLILQPQFCRDLSEASLAIELKFKTSKVFLPLHS